MTAKQQALRDIQEELQKEHKSFCGFIISLNPVMQNLVHSQVMEQVHKFRKVSPRKRIVRPSNLKHIATCFFINGSTNLKWYALSKYISLFFYGYQFCPVSFLLQEDVNSL